MNKFKITLKTIMIILLIFIDDFFILLGAGIIINQTYRINAIAGNYSLGVAFFMFGIFLANKERTMGGE
jgi:hypothetical protein